MSYSLNEMEATAKRATRGAGYSWGLAEEASKAARWLCAQGLDGSAYLVRVLDSGLAKNPPLHRPKTVEGVWQGENNLCPLAVGSLLSDCAKHLQHTPIEMHNIAVPSMLLPFVAQAARALGSTICVTCDGLLAETNGTALHQNQAFADTATSVIVARSTTVLKPTVHVTRAFPTKESWNSLNQFAHRTYAPATEESRKLGAGAGLSDND